ncbi:mandelate racemase/muconate lactonizing enzyme family protein [Gluconobacter kanchanaburiensis]|uniref:Mandelate racemase n=1 Tax=Gluconobacter kanchanaburiensis NBRC 103587 TaxID=1307948 RepID=A0A511BF83_9PROT|nr:mandelate racemase/muconate lactonizing enzyme family protein [Gluconobacter kanchanaburiensis]MBF0862441.1 mandelate racemase/muconate lactonizing enzyme family protein [Gluconobacter kanchanaburiensis]GBR68637.1 mandelate racemase [Gluconobacter kanchanaburiensis NBRC 103587]GEK96437.1 mandelate racemase [Gluconobacter kanchanaburiensis NBRC 103587]
MSRIESVEGLAFRLPAALTGQARDEECFLLRIVTEDGLTGWGEAHGSPYLSRAVVNAPKTHVTAQGLRGILSGADAKDIRALRRRMEKETQWIGRDGVVMQAIAAAELALWDLAGQRAGLPVSRLLSPEARSSIACYASDKVAATPERTALRIRAEREAGFRAHKLGWPPFGASEESDVAFLEAARTVAPDATLMVDAAQAYTLDEAISRAKAFKPFRLAWIEEPLDRDDLEGQKTLRARSVVPIASGEGECSLIGLRRIAPLVDILQPDITRCGLIAACDIAPQVPEVCSHSFTTPLNIAMHAHWLAAMPNALFLEWPMSKAALWSPYFLGALAPEDGQVGLPQTPGWGIRPDLDALAPFIMPAEG